MNTYWLEWLGYLASFIVLISLLMSSIIKLRWINLLGSVIFSLYGFWIGALPVGFMNLGIAIINIYYLWKIYASKDQFKILPIENNTRYFEYFLEYYQNNIYRYKDLKDLKLEKSSIRFFILRNMVPAGLFIGSKVNENTLKVELDFVIPEYRDFKIGNYIYEDMKDYFLKRGYHQFITYTTKEDHQRYLEKMGFKEVSKEGDLYYLKKLKRCK